ncbi:MAG TPA: PAS domain-containing sensor histidine kinase, partial [Sphingobacterium sp.]|nr:PAS domain-containing sensor histidine kinase [Sphingobacterium sp.]
NEYLDLLKTSNDSLTDTLEELSEILELRENTNILKDNCNFSLIYTKIYSQFIGEIQSKNAQLTADFQVENIHYPTKYLESIVNNLLSNALKFTDPNIAPQIHIRTYIEDNTPIFSIEDNGIGIDIPKYKSQLFMFRKVFHRGFDSKGIGLFITRYQVEALGGKIDIKSAPGKGTTFLVRFLKTTT